MKNLNTQGTLRKVYSTITEWLDTGGRLELIQYCCLGQFRFSLPSARLYLDSLLHSISQRAGTDSEVDLGYYILRSSEDRSYVTIKKTAARIPRSADKFMRSAEWDVKIENRQVESTHMRHLYWHYLTGKAGYQLSSYPVYRNLHLCSLSHALLQSLFGPGDKVDFTRKLLPTNDLSCRLGNYMLLYDHLAEEWRVWKKS